MTDEPIALFESFSESGDTASYLFTGLTDTVVAWSPGEVLPALQTVAEAVSAGFHAAGFVTYEAATGVNPALTTCGQGPLPLLRFGLFRQRQTLPPGSLEQDSGGYRTTAWRANLTEQEYTAAFRLIRRYIAAGDTYQVNFTTRLTFHLAGSPFALYRDLCRSQRSPYSAFLDLGRHQILSTSPELFFKLSGRTLTTRPMKGTAVRGRWLAEDEALKEGLATSAKERAENLMIVDLLRNDMGVVAETGSVRVESLFQVGTYPTVHQMTSHITATIREDVGIPELFRALFPCGSVTGAPKRRTMEIIAKLEDGPRGIYTGCIGFISPGSEAVFSVAIRTAVVDTLTGEGELGVGSGVTWDSRPEAEYEECLAKGAFARQRPDDFQLLESLLYEDKGYFLLERHLDRLEQSARYFAFPLDRERAKTALLDHAKMLTGAAKVRLLLDYRGAMTVESAPVVTPEQDTLLAGLAVESVDSGNRLLYHKTTSRELSIREMAQRPECADVIFCNERDEVTEGAYSNLVVALDGELVTPPLSAGLLPGVFREELLAQGVIRERTIRKDELLEAQEIYLINSVRRWRRVRIIR